MVRPARSHWKKLLVLCAILVFVFQSRTSQLAVIALGAKPGDGRLPADWQIKVNHGKPDVSACNETDGRCIHLKSSDSSFSLERSLNVSPAETPYLSWNWKVTRLPAGGDFRKSSTDDQAAQVLVAFADRRVLSYIWDSTAPKGAIRNFSPIPVVHVSALV